MTTIQNSTFKEKKLSNLPSDWSVCLLGENAQIRGRIGWKGLKQEEYTEDGPFLIAGKHIKSGKILWDSCDHINETRFDESKEIALELDDIIFSKDGSLGNPALVDFMPGPATINSTMMLVRCSNAALSSHYLFQVLKSDFFDALVRERVSGSSIPHIFQRDMKDFQFPWPTLAEQKKIAAILTAVDDKLDVIARQIEATQTLKRGLMQTLFSRGVGTQDADGRWVPHAEFKDSELGEIPACWDVTTVGEVCEVKGGKRLPKGEVLTDENTGFPYIRVTDMYMGGINTEGVLYVPAHVQPSIARYTISKDDIFISVAGTLGLTGIVPEELDGANLTENADKLTNIMICRHYLLYYLCSDAIQDTIKKEGTANAQPKLALTRIRDFSLPLPAREEQEQIAAVLRSIDEKLGLLQSKETHWKDLKRGLMQKLLTGEWRVSIDASASDT